jgi:hypothetical protein
MPNWRSGAARGQMPGLNEMKPAKGAENGLRFRREMTGTAPD